MNDQFKRQFEDMLGVAKDARIPDNVQQIAEQTVERSHDAYLKISNVARDNAKMAEEVILTAQAGAKSIGEKFVTNTLSNTDAVFEAARSIARAKTLPEMARLQAEFMQSQAAIVGQQAREFLDLSNKLMRHSFETMSTATAKTMKPATGRKSG